MEKENVKDISEECIEQLAETKYPISKGGPIWCPSAHDCNQANKQEGFIEGYKQAKSETSFNLNDMRKCFEAARQYKKYDIVGYGGIQTKKKAVFATAVDYIQSLFKQP